MIVDAIYADGVFKPVQSVALPENESVRITVESNSKLSSAEWMKRVREFRRKIEAKYGVLPDSTEVIRADRCRDV